jgi:hypothetical protein
LPPTSHRKQRNAQTTRAGNAQGLGLLAFFPAFLWAKEDRRHRFVAAVLVVALAACGRSVRL